MCVIVVKKKNVDMPSMEALHNCFTSNRDGAGMMYVDNDEVVIEKGFMTWEDYKSRLEELMKQYNNFEGKSFVSHFRIGTQGENDEHTCHPFPISSKHKMLRKTHLRTDVAMVHNGIISEYGSHSTYSKLHPKDKQLSDTQLFIRYTVNAFKSLNRNFYKNNQVMECLAHITEGSKLCFLDKEDNLYLTGNYVTDEETGVIYSNTSYKSYTSYYTPSYSWKDWYEDVIIDNEEKACISQSSGNKYDEDYMDYIGQFYGEYVSDDILEYLIPLKKDTTVYLADAGYHMTIGKDNNYYLDEWESILYTIDEDYNVLDQLGFGWVDEGGETA